MTATKTKAKAKKSPRSPRKGRAYEFAVKDIEGACRLWKPRNGRMKVMWACGDEYEFDLRELRGALDEAEAVGKASKHGWVPIEETTGVEIGEDCRFRVEKKKWLRLYIDRDEWQIDFASLRKAFDRAAKGAATERPENLHDGDGDLDGIRSSPVLLPPPRPPFTATRFGVRRPADRR